MYSSSGIQVNMTPPRSQAGAWVLVFGDTWQASRMLAETVAPIGLAEQSAAHHAEARVAWQLLKVAAFGPVCCMTRRQGIRGARGGLGGPARTSGRGRDWRRGSGGAAGGRWSWVVYLQAAADSGGDGVEVAFV